MPTLAPASLGLRASAINHAGKPEYVRHVRADMRRLPGGCPVSEDRRLFTRWLKAWPRRSQGTQAPMSRPYARHRAQPGRGLAAIHGLSAIPAGERHLDCGLEIANDDRVSSGEGRVMRIRIPRTDIWWLWRWRS